MDISSRVSNKLRNMSIVCAFLVVVIHCRLHFQIGTSAWWLRQICEEGLCRIAVPFFFIVSGYLLAYKMILGGGGYIVEVRKRFKSLIIPFVIWNVAFIAIKNMFQIVRILRGLEPNFVIPTVMDLGLWFGGLPIHSPLWYMRVLFLLVIISPVLLWVCRRCGILFLSVLFVTYVVGRAFAYRIGCLEMLTEFGVFCLPGFFWFSIGISFSIGILPSKMSISPSVSILVGLLLTVGRAALVYYDYPIEIIRMCGYLCIPFLLYGAWRIIPSSEWPEWLVSCSFAVYLIHKFVLLLLNDFADAGQSIVMYFSTAVIAFITSIFIAILLKRYLPRVSNVLFGGR